MKNVWAKVLGCQLLALVLVVGALLLGKPPVSAPQQNAQFDASGQALAASLARVCSQQAAHRGGPSTQVALDGAGQTPGVVAAWVATRRGRLYAHAQSTRLPAALMLRMALPASAQTDVTLPKTPGVVTVFRQPVAGGVVACVAIQRAAGAAAGEHRQRLLLILVASILLASLAVSLLLAWRGLAPVRALTQAARRVEAAPQGDLEFVPVTSPDVFGRLTTAFNDMLAAVWQHHAEVRLDEAKYRSLFENAAHGVWQSTPAGRCLCLNPAMLHIFGCDTADALRKVLEDKSAYVSATRRGELDRLLKEQGTVTGFESQARRGDGSIIWISESVRAVRDETGALVGWEGAVTDITARKRAEAERAHLGNYLRLLMESSGEGIYGVDPQGNCTFINTAGAQMLGYLPSEVLGRPMHALAHHSHPDGVLYPQERSFLYQSIQIGQKYRVDNEVLWRKDGSKFPAEYTAAPLIEGGRTAGAVVTFVDITVRKSVEAEQQRLLAEALERADHDPLTGLLNHRAFHKRLHEEADRAQRGGNNIALVLLDIDNFKFFNDVYGHKVGDEVLCLVADALRHASRSYDVLARYGGDEFVLLMPCEGSETAASLAAHLGARLSGVSYTLPDYDIRIPLGLSLGVALFPEEAPTRPEALQIADDRLRRAKTGGDEDDYAEQVRSSATREREGFSMLDALVTAVDNKDRYTRRHSEDVMRYSVQIAREMGQDEATQRLVEVAALIHDVGKIGVPDSILRKPGQLTDDEFAAVRQHPIMGAVIAEAVVGFEETLDAIRHHHERWDGKGYPAGLSGTSIPFLARLMAVADSYSAMTTDRPYRKGMAREKALNILRDGAGVQWDAQCVDAFVRAQQAVAA